MRLLFAVAAVDMVVVDGNCTILFTVGGRIVLLDMIDICWLSGFGLFTGVVEKYAGCCCCWR